MTRAKLSSSLPTQLSLLLSMAHSPCDWNDVVGVVVVLVIDVMDLVAMPPLLRSYSVDASYVDLRRIDERRRRLLPWRRWRRLHYFWCRYRMDQRWRHL